MFETKVTFFSWEECPAVIYFFICESINHLQNGMFVP